MLRPCMMGGSPASPGSLAASQALRAYSMGAAGSIELYDRNGALQRLKSPFTRLALLPYTHICPSCSTGPSRLSQFRSRDYSSASIRWGSCSTEGCPQLMTAPSTTTTCYQAGVMVRDWTEQVTIGLPDHD